MQPGVRRLARTAGIRSKALAVWTTNTITFGLQFWTLDRDRHAGSNRVTAAGLPLSAAVRSAAGAPGWHPHFFDYLYISFTNSIAFRPTDTMPLTHSAKA